MALLTARTAIRAILAIQIGLAATLLARDLSAVAPTLSLPAAPAPSLDAPVAPGDQTRRFAPVRIPFRPARPMPGLTEMPARLLIDDADPRRVRLTGEIVTGDAGRFADWLEARAAAPDPLPEVLLLHSPGGAVSEALEIGRSLRAAGLSTSVEAGDLCLSACPYILAAGVRRTVSTRAQVGVHQHYFGEQTLLPAFLAVEDIQRGQAEVVTYLDAMGVDLRLMAPAMATPPEDIYVLLPEELTGYRLATAMTP